ncbi:MAG: M1 family aminopeptidase [Woeseiaceae bacterium]|nr:M1 family aminopeptidase [Woeseiaceae bacterium]
MDKATITILLCTFVGISPGIANQDTFDTRPERVLEPHDFDVEHYRIALTIEGDTQSFTGETHVSFSSLVDDLDSVMLNTVNFIVSGVIDDRGNSLEFTQDDVSLTIALHRSLEKYEVDTLVIEYAATRIGIDKTVGLDFRLETETNPQLANSLNWPIGARYWFPSFDHPSDWASHETIITTRSMNRVVANGSLVSDFVDTESDLRTVHWRQAKPQPTYLYSFAAGPYTILKDQHGELPLHYWVYPGDETVGKQAFARTSEIIGYYEDLYGTEFPWVKYDQIIVPGMPGGAESTSATLLTRNVIQQERDGNNGANDWLLAHEIAHQWWGNMIGFRDWTHAWISESFASDGEYLFILNDGGVEAGALYLLSYKDSYFKEAHEKYIRPIVTNKWDKPNDMFDRHGYEKGAVVLNMFREMIGAGTYNRILNRFIAEHAYSNVTTDDFLEMVKEVTGLDYFWFFDQWLFRPGHPVLDVSYVWDAQDKVLTLTVTQIQDTGAGVPIYRLPLNLGITTRKGGKVESVWLTEQSQSFAFDVTEQPLLVRFDEGDILLKEWILRKSVPELLYQLNNDNVIGRLWAIDELENHTANSSVRSALEDIADRDAVEVVRKAALEVLAAG